MARTKNGLPGIYNASPLTLADGDGAALALDSNGYTKVNVVAGGATGIADQSTFTPASTLGSLSLGTYETSPETLSNNQVAAIGVDVNRNVKVTLATLIAGEDLTNNVLKVEQRFSYQRMTSAATLLVKSGAGFLHAIIVNTPVASGVIELDDALTNTTPIIGKITYPGTLISDGPVTVTYDLSFATGLSITTTNTMDITIVYR